MANEVASFNEKILTALDDVVVYVPEQGGLLGDPLRLHDSINRFKELDKPADNLINEAEKLIKNNNAWHHIDTTPYYDLGDFSIIYDAAAVSGRKELHYFVWSLIERMLAVDCWVAQVHRPMTYDHCTANVASQISLALDRIGDGVEEGSIDDVRRRLREKFLAGFVNTWENQLDVWSKQEYLENWKIMTCGETGLGVIYCWDGSKLGRRALRGCIEGVLQILATLPETGEYPEGFGYWLTTMTFGLRFGIALRQATHGMIDLLQHPRLGATATFLLNMCRPDGTVYAWGDNCSDALMHKSDIEGRMEAKGAINMTMLGSALKRGDILHLTRSLPICDFNQVFYDDVTVQAEVPKLESAIYLNNQLNVCVMRDDWNDNTTFAGFKCGNPRIGHGHLDQNSFAINRGSAHLAIDQGLWSYAHFLGFFSEPSRWDFDGTSSFGHNGILVDGQGQVPTESIGQIEAHGFSDDMDYVVGQAAACYGGRLSNFQRWFIWLKPDIFLVVDRLASDQPRLYEWIFQHRGDLESAPPDHSRYNSVGDVYRGEHFATPNIAQVPLSPHPRSVIRQGEHALTIDMIYPSSYYGLRVSDVRRQSFYATSKNKFVDPYVQYRSYSPLHTAQQLTFVVGMYLGQPEDISMRLLSNEMNRPDYGYNSNDRHWTGWPEQPIPAPQVEFAIKGQSSQTILLDEVNLSVKLT